MVKQMQHDYADGPVAQDYGELLGAPFKVFLANGVEEKLDEKTGKVMTEITDLPGLIACVLQTRVLHPRKLSGEDLKFIRVALRMRSVDVAEALDVSPEHYSRCETGVKTLSSSTEKFFRMRVFLQAGYKNKAIQEELSKMKEEKFDPEEIKEVVEAFQSMFFDMKIKSVSTAGEQLEFHFIRGRERLPEHRGNGGNKKWRKEPFAIAA